jgi:hypothetical protein
MILFTSVIYKCSLYVRAFLPGKPFQPSELQHSSLLGPFLSSKEHTIL